MFNNICNFFKIVLPVSFLVSCADSDAIAQARLLEKQQQARLQKQQWVDSVYQSLNLDQRIGQLFMVNAYSGGKNYNDSLISILIEKNYIGGIIFMQGTAEAQAHLTNKYQQKSHIPLMIGMDAEWGLGMRLTGVDNFPRQMMLGATRDYDLVYEMGKRIAEQCKLIGVHINFAPDIDINNNPHNPVINFRSFGEDKHWVSRLGLAYMRGMQDQNVLACAKHFPGHGDVDVDSHYDLPVIHKSKSQLDSMELYPFKVLSDSGVASVMIAHLSIPQIEPGRNVPTTLSHNIITGILKKQIGFEGLIITDALNMEGLTKYFADGEADLKAFEAGNDILLFSKNVPLAVRKIKDAVSKRTVSEERLAYSVKKILAYKYQLGLNVKPQLLATDSLTPQLNYYIRDFKYKTASAAITIVRDGSLFSGNIQSTQKIAYLPINGEKETFAEDLKAAFPSIQIIRDANEVKDYDWVVAGVHDIALYPGKDKTYGISNASKTMVGKVADKDNVIMVYFGNAYAAQLAIAAKNIIVTYEDHVSTHTAAAALLSGKLKAKGVLPVSIY